MNINELLNTPPALGVSIVSSITPTFVAEQNAALMTVSMSVDVDPEALILTGQKNAELMKALEQLNDENKTLREELDARIIYHATWLEVVKPGRGYHFECSRCGTHWMLDASTYTCQKTPFCPKCGAKMDGEEVSEG